MNNKSKQPKEDGQQQELTQKEEQKNGKEPATEQKDESQAASAPIKSKVHRPIPAFEEHSILPNVLHDDAQANLVSVPLAEVDQFYGDKEVIIYIFVSSLKLYLLFCAIQKKSLYWHCWTID